MYPNVLPQELRNHLGSFGIGGQLATQTIFTLSGGQKSRVALGAPLCCLGSDSRVLVHHHYVEPTRHL